MSFSRFIRSLHLVLGLTSGLVVFVVSITGALYVFKDELSEKWYHDAYFLKKTGPHTLPVSVLQAKAQQALGPKDPVSTMTAYRDPYRAWTFGTYTSDPSAWTYFGQMVSVKTVFMDPYTGRVHAVMDNKYEFFMLVKTLHSSLWLRSRIGQPVVGWATAIFVVMLVTGVVLVFRKQNDRYLVRNRWTMKWTGNWRRLTYDLHNVPGLYFTLVLLVIALTGLVIVFSPLRKLEYQLGSSWANEKGAAPVLALPSADENASGHPLDIAVAASRKAYPNAPSIAFYPPFPGDTLLYTYPNLEKGTIYRFDQLVFNGITGKSISVTRFEDKNGGQQLNAINYDLHAGSLFGWPGKLMAFLAALVSASLPVTGAMMWWGRKKSGGR